MTRRVFVDTSAWFAYVDRKDGRHAEVAEALAGARGRRLTSNHVLDETLTLCRARLGHAAAVRIGTALRDPHVVELVRATPADEEAAWELFVSRADQPYSFTDCTSFVLMRRVGLDTAISLDDDFVREGFRVRPE